MTGCFQSCVMTMTLPGYDFYYLPVLFESFEESTMFGISPSACVNVLAVGVRHIGTRMATVASKFLVFLHCELAVAAAALADVFFRVLD